MRSCGRSATSGSRLFMSIRSAASWGQPLQDSSRPRGARTSGICATVTRRAYLDPQLSPVGVDRRLGLAQGNHQAPIAAGDRALGAVAERTELDLTTAVGTDQHQLIRHRVSLPARPLYGARAWPRGAGGPRARRPPGAARPPTGLPTWSPASWAGRAQP